MQHFFCLLFFIFILTGSIAYADPDNAIPDTSSSLITRPPVFIRPQTSSAPGLISGIWQGSDRLILFTSGSENLFITLRMFYTWYDDRAAESKSYTATYQRDVNDTTSVEPERLSVMYQTIIENSKKTAGAYEISVTYPNNKEPFIIPVAVINGKLYLQFLIHGRAEESDYYNGNGKNETIFGYWRAAGAVTGISISYPKILQEITSYYFLENSVYYIRYWLSEMPYTYDTATFTDGDQNFSVDKYIRAGTSVYTCATGRRTEIRNIQKSSFPLQNTVTDDEYCVCAIGSPYLVKVSENENIDQFQKIITDNNSRTKPAPKPLFPPTDIDFHWKDISDLEKYNPWTWNRRNIDLGK